VRINLFFLSTGFFFVVSYVEFILSSKAREDGVENEFCFVDEIA